MDFSRHTFGLLCWSSNHVYCCCCHEGSLFGGKAQCFDDVKLPYWEPRREKSVALSRVPPLTVISFAKRGYMQSMATRFELRKQKILAQLETPEGQYHDLSPKGSVDEPIRELIDEINNLNGLVTTSSCSGRISVFLEGRKQDLIDAPKATDSENARAGPGGKGGGGAWLYISHKPIGASTLAGGDLTSALGLNGAVRTVKGVLDPSYRYIHLKFEPMVCVIPWMSPLN